VHKREKKEVCGQPTVGARARARDGSRSRWGARGREKGPSRQPGWRKLRAAAEAAADAAGARKPEDGRERGEGSRQKPLVSRNPKDIWPHLNFCIGISYRLQMMRARKYCHVCRIQMNSSSYAKHMKTKHGNTTTTPGAASFFPDLCLPLSAL
jgi:hypothetical protein